VAQHDEEKREDKDGGVRWASRHAVGTGLEEVRVVEKQAVCIGELVQARAQDGFRVAQQARVIGCLLAAQAGNEAARREGGGKGAREELGLVISPVRMYLATKFRVNQ